MRILGSLSGNFEGALETYVAAEEITAGDLVTLQSGELACAAAGEEICGVAMNSAADGESVLVNVDPLVKVSLGGASLTAAMVGTNMDIKGLTGAQLFDQTTSGTGSAQVTLIKFISATEGVFVIHENQLIA